MDQARVADSGAPHPPTITRIVISIKLCSQVFFIKMTLTSRDPDPGSAPEAEPLL